MPENRRYMGSPSYVPGVRSRGVLRLFKESPCASSLSFHATSDHSVGGTWRGLEVVLHRRDLSLRRPGFLLSHGAAEVENTEPAYRNCGMLSGIPRSGIPPCKFSETAQSLRF